MGLRVGVPRGVHRVLVGKAMTQSHTTVRPPISAIPACEVCGITREAVHCFARGGAGGSAEAKYTTVWQAPGRADGVLGHPGYLCNQHWWEELRKAAAA
jgi:hypothetical protein